jgi:hypothetical protein
MSLLIILAVWRKIDPFSFTQRDSSSKQIDRIAYIMRLFYWPFIFLTDRISVQPGYLMEALYANVGACVACSSRNKEIC